MPTINYTPFLEGEDLTAAGMNQRVNEVANGLNALDDSSVERHGLRYVHMPLLSAPGLFPAGFSKEAPLAAASVLDNYDNGLPALGGGGTGPTDYQTFSPNGPNAPYGPTGAPDDGAGWKIPAYQNVVADAAEVIINGGTAINLTTQRLKLLVRASIEVVEADGSGGSVNGTNSFIVGIGWEDGTTTRHVLERTVRWCSHDAIERGDCVTSTLITQADIAASGPGDGTIASVFMVVAGGARGSATGALDNGAQADVRYYNISCLPLHAGDL